MIEYNIVNGKLMIDPTTLTVQAFNAIWNYDTTRNKSKASNLLTYVFTLCDERDRNPFRDIPYDKKEAACKKNAFGNVGYKFSQEEEKLVGSAIEWFEFLNRNSIQRLSISMDKKIDQLAKFLDDNAISSSEDFDLQTDMMTKIDKILKSKRETDKLVREELEKVRVKGNASRSPLSKGLLD
jgi:hypothetical protein